MESAFLSAFPDRHSSSGSDDIDPALYGCLFREGKVAKSIVSLQQSRLAFAQRMIRLHLNALDTAQPVGRGSDAGKVILPVIAAGNDRTTQNGCSTLRIHGCVSNIAEGHILQVQLTAIGCVSTALVASGDILNGSIADRKLIAVGADRLIVGNIFDGQVPDRTDTCDLLFLLGIDALIACTNHINLVAGNIGCPMENSVSSTSSSQTRSGVSAVIRAPRIGAGMANSF